MCGFLARSILRRTAVVLLRWRFTRPPANEQAGRCIVQLTQILSLR
jgi:hypothetical protein